FLHVGKHQDGHLGELVFVQEFLRLQQAAGDVGVGRRLHRLQECIDLLEKDAFLLVGSAGSIIKHHLGDDILLAETAGIDTGNGKDIAGVELDEQVGDDLPCLVQLLRVGAGGVEQHVDAAALRCIRGGAAADKQGERSDQGESGRAS